MVFKKFNFQRKMKTDYLSKQKAQAERGWRVIDAEGQVVGRIASKVAAVLRGKDKAYFAPHQDTGDFVIVVNADKIKFTGQKLDKKVYRYHTGYVGGVKEETAGKLLQRKPEEIIKRAVKGMLPKTAQGRGLISKLKVYAGPNHPHTAQKPTELTVH